MSIRNFNTIVLFTSLVALHPDLRMSGDEMKSLSHGFKHPPVSQSSDTIPGVVFTPADTDVKVTMADDARESKLEFTPYSSLLKGALIQPSKGGNGLSTNFYLSDTSSWSFYTNSKEKLTIGGGADMIRASGPLLIGQQVDNDLPALRVNGNARVDSMFVLQGTSDSMSFISLHRNLKSVNEGEDDGISPYTSTPTAWSLEHIPAFRLRHPRNVTGRTDVNSSIQRDFKILPYEFGMAIEFNGVVECWVGEWSIHKGNYYVDVEGKGNGWGAVSWVGDDLDLGGVRMTARNNVPIGGNVQYGEISVEKFVGTPNGDFRFRLPSTQNNFQFIYGERGSNNVIATMKKDGLIIPKVSSTANTQSPEKAQIVFDSTSNSFKGFDGLQWVNLGETKLATGSFSATSTGLDLVYAIPHGLGREPNYFNVIATSRAAANVGYVTADSTYLFVWYTSPPAFGENNLSWNWQAR